MDVVQITMAVQLLADSTLDLSKKMDNELFQHVSYVTSKCLRLVRDGGANKATFIECGKYLWRLYMVVSAYNYKCRDVTLTELLTIVKEFKGVFVG